MIRYLKKIQRLTTKVNNITNQSAGKLHNTNKNIIGGVMVQVCLS